MLGVGELDWYASTMAPRTVDRPSSERIAKASEWERMYFLRRGRMGVLSSPRNGFVSIFLMPSIHTEQSKQ